MSAKKGSGNIGSVLSVVIVSADKTAIMQEAGNVGECNSVFVGVCASCEFLCILCYGQPVIDAVVAVEFGIWVVTGELFGYF